MLRIVDHGEGGMASVSCRYTPAGQLVEVLKQAGPA